ncbi:cation transporter, partial [Arthrobacter sp. H14-L1]|nr:cation transporter [Arthrobacter sp. H14-L1]
LQGNASIQVSDTTITAAGLIVTEARHRLSHALPNLDQMSLQPVITPFNHHLDHQTPTHG